MTSSSTGTTSGWAVGFTAFAAMIMILIGFFQAAMGLVGVLNQEFYVRAENYTFAFDIGTWAWFHLIWGVIVLIAGFSVLSGQVWARTVGIIVAIISAIEAFAFVPYQPFWSIVVITLSVLVIWALTTRVDIGEDLDEAI